MEVLERYIEGDQTAEGIVADGFDARTVHRVVHMVDAAEYQAQAGRRGVKDDGPRVRGRQADADCPTVRAGHRRRPRPVGSVMGPGNRKIRPADSTPDER